MQELGRPLGGGWEGVALVVEHVAGQADRRQGRAQLVRDVRDEPLLHARELGQLVDLLCMLSAIPLKERARMAMHVLALLGDPHVELAAGEAFDWSRRRTGSVLDDESDDDPRDHPDRGG